ncbi:hypothetical protein AWENTII_011734 [Aspergillus wentii]
MNTNKMNYLNPLPWTSPAKWAWLSLTAFASLPGTFNRTIFDAPWTATVSDPVLQETLTYLNTTDFVAYTPDFLSIIGPNATIEHVQHLPYQSHEAPCYIPSTKQLFFVEWGPPGGENGTHTWQYLLDVETNTLQKITTSPPTVNAHGCVHYDGQIYVVTDGSESESGYVARIDSVSLKRETVVNNFLGQPFMGFNDLEIDREGGFWVTDFRSGWGRGIIPYTPPTNPSIYYINSTTLQTKLVHTTTGNTNGIAISPDSQTVYIPDTGVSEFRPSAKNPYGKREVWAFDVSSGAVLSNKRLLASPVSYFYDGLRVSRGGWLFAGSGDGVDVIDPVTGFVLGSIRVGGGRMSL